MSIVVGKDSTITLGCGRWSAEYVYAARVKWAAVDEAELAPGALATRDFALWLPGPRAIAISDLHLGYEGALAEQGIGVPRIQRRIILERLGRILDRYKPAKVVVCGDFKHEFSKALVDEWVEVKQVLRFLRSRTEPVLVRGNHDNYLLNILSDLGMKLLDRYDLPGFTFVHGHEDVASLGTIVMGHEHPAVKLRDPLGATVSVPAFVAGERLIVLPAFSPLALGVDVAAYPYLSPILNRMDLEDARVVGIDEGEGLLDFGRVGNLKDADASLLLR